MKKFIVVKDREVIYDTNNYLNAKRKYEKEESVKLYEEM